jgi:hypothetical protein
MTRELQKVKPGEWGCVQVHDPWSPKEHRQVCPGHFWLLKFGKVPGTMSCVEKVFKVDTRKYEEYKGVRFGDGDSDLVFLGSGGNDRQLFRVVCRRLRPQKSDTTTTRDGDVWRTTYARHDPQVLYQVDSRNGYQEVCTLRG